MISLNHSTWAPTERKHYLLILAVLIVVQLARTLSNSCRLFVFMFEETDGAFLPSQWWTAIDIRSCFWLCVAPLLAYVITKYKAPPLNKTATHLLLLATGVFLSGTVIRQVSFQQAVERELIRGISTQALGEQPTTSAAPPKQQGGRRVVLLQPQQETDTIAPLAILFWVGEFAICMTDYALMALVGYAVLYFRISEHRAREAERLRSMLVQSRHDVLRNRLTHHFLFNTLNSISSLTLTDGAAARTCISQLGQLLRASIDSLPRGVVRLDEELRDLEIYLSLQQVRFGSRLEYSFDIEPGLEHSMVPAFLLQPLVENSFEHGFAEQRDEAKIWIVARRQGEHCRLEISDNGVGMNHDHTIEERYGLGVTRERLKLQYDGSADIGYEANHPRGLSVTVLIPCRLAKGPST